jgi:hypothetical protein
LKLSLNTAFKKPQPLVPILPQNDPVHFFPSYLFTTYILSIVWEMKKYYTESRRRGISYIE